MTGIRHLPSMLTAFHWNPHKLSPQGSFCCPFLPFFGQDTNRLGRCGSILILAISLLIGPCPTSLVIPLHKWTRTFNDLHIQLGDLGISHTERDRMHGHEPDGTWHANIWNHGLLKKLGPGPRGRLLQSETTKAERNHRDFGCYFGPFPAPSSPSGSHGAKDEFRSLGEFAEAERRMAVTYCHVTCPNSCWSPKTDQTKHSYGISVTSRQSPKRAYSWGSV